MYYTFIIITDFRAQVYNLYTDIIIDFHAQVNKLYSIIVNE